MACEHVFYVIVPGCLMSVMFHFDSGVPSMVFLGLRLNRGKVILVKLSMVSKEVLASGQWRETGTLG